MLGVPIARTIVFWGLYWGLLILGNCQGGVHVGYSLNSLMVGYIGDSIRDYNRCY